ncbi:hypothetical protein M1145_02330 [Patescibacteria group bacterium]|nr:hypothetical protein [Patescibacteria group bacterium]
MKESKTLQKLFFWVGVLAVVLAAVGFFDHHLRFILAPHDYMLVSVVLFVLSLDAKNGSTFLSK